MSRTPDYSIGLVLVDGTDDRWPDNKEHSFHVNPAGKVVELYGWARHGSTRFTPPANQPPAENYTTVYLSGRLTTRAKDAVRELAAEHRQRFGGLMIWAAPGDGAVAEWVNGGLTDPPKDRDHGDLGDHKEADGGGTEGRGGGEQHDEPEGTKPAEDDSRGQPGDGEDPGPDPEADAGHSEEAGGEGPDEEE